MEYIHLNSEGHRQCHVSHDVKAFLPYQTKKCNDSCNLMPVNNSVNLYFGSSPRTTKLLCMSVFRHRLKNWSGVPSPAAKSGLLSFNWMQSRIVTGLLTGNNTLRRHFHVMELNNSPFVGGVEQRRKSQHTCCVSVSPWLHSDRTLWFRFSRTLKISEFYGQSGTLLTIWLWSWTFTV